MCGGMTVQVDCVMFGKTLLLSLDSWGLMSKARPRANAAVLFFTLVFRRRTSFRSGRRRDFRPAWATQLAFEVFHMHRDFCVVRVHGHTLRDAVNPERVPPGRCFRHPHEQIEAPFSTTELIAQRLEGL